MRASGVIGLKVKGRVLVYRMCSMCWRQKGLCPQMGQRFFPQISRTISGWFWERDLQEQASATHSHALSHKHFNAVQIRHPMGPRHPVGLLYIYVATVKVKNTPLDILHESWKTHSVTRYGSSPFKTHRYICTYRTFYIYMYI